MAIIDRDRWRELEPLLDRALELPDEERAAFLAALRSSAPDDAAELAALFDGEAEADRQGFLAAPLSAATVLAARALGRRGPDSRQWGQTPLTVTESDPNATER